jgi:hypothetical protein
MNLGPTYDNIQTMVLVILMLQFEPQYLHLKVIL